MGHTKLDPTGNSATGLNETEMNRMFGELYAAPGASVESIKAAIAAKPEIAALTAETTADATNHATARALTNALKIKVNEIIAALKA